MMQVRHSCQQIPILTRFTSSAANGFSKGIIVGKRGKLTVAHDGGVSATDSKEPFVSEDDSKPLGVTSPTGPRVCILGGGFGGLYTAVKLDQLMWPKGTKPKVTLVDQHERFVFKPLLYELLTGKASDEDVAPPFRQLLGSTKVNFVQASVKEVIPQKQESEGSQPSTGGRVVFSDGTWVDYDWLVLALGANPKLGMIDGAMQHALPFSSYEDVQKLKSRLSALLAAPSPRKVAIVGANYAGVELALAVKEIVGSSGDVQIITPDAEIMAGSSPAMQQGASQALSTAGVEVVGDTRVTKITREDPPAEASPAPAPLPNYTLTLTRQQVEGAQKQEVQLVLWTAGQDPATIVDMSGKKVEMASTKFPFPRNDKGQTLTAETLLVEGSPQVFALGDVAMSRQGGQTTEEILPPTAQVALQQADYVAWNIWAGINGRKLLPFRYQHLGTMVAFGNRSGMLQLPLRLPPALSSMLTQSPIASAARTLGVNLQTDDVGLTITGPFAALIRRLAYVYRQPTLDQQLQAGGNFVAAAGKRAAQRVSQNKPSSSSSSTANAST